MTRDVARFVAPDFLSLTIGIVVFFIGVLITQRVKFLQNFSIPEPVSGGFIAVVAISLIYFVFNLQIDFDLTTRDRLLVIFFATVGINSGQAFLTTVVQTGPVLLLIGAAVVLSAIAVVLLIGHFVLRIPYDDLLGVASGATGNPAILVYANRMAPTERTNIAYAMIFPSATIVKVVGVQIAGLALLP